MGISSLPSPSEGMLCIILVNTALSISMMKSLIRSVFGVFGISFASPDSVEIQPESIQCRSGPSPSESYVEDFRSRTPTVRFDSLFEHEQDCSVCLNEFEPESEINHLSCGHLFHKSCLEKWLKYWNVTCPLCRNPLIPEEETSCVW